MEKNRDKDSDYESFFVWEMSTSMFVSTDREEDLLPTFFVVGAQKAGTSTLDRWLRDYPEIGLPKGKETHFFSNIDRFERGLDWYMKQFPKYQAGQIRGEVAPQYMYSKDAANRIQQLIPSPRLIFLLRHPIDRAYSNYLMSVRQGVEALSFSEALAKEDVRLAKCSEFERNYYGYMARGQYARQIHRYLEQFPASPIHFALFEDLMDTEEGLGDKVYAEIISFIGLTYVLPPDRSVKVNRASEPRLKSLRNFLYSSSSLKRWLGSLLPSRDIREQIAHFLDRLNQKSIQNDRCEVSEQVIEACIAETTEMERITGLNFDKWHALTEKYKSIG